MKIAKCMKRFFSKRILPIALAVCLTAGSIPAVGIEGIGSLVVQAAEGLSIDNGYIKVTVSEKNGGYGIRTVTGDKVNKDDNNKALLFEYDDDNTSFTSFQVTRNGETREYIFGGKYEGSSKVSVSKVNEELVAVWSVDDLTFTQRISLVNSGANEHGTAYISYSVENAGEAAEIKCRMLMDTCLGEQDFAYYNIGDSNNLLEREVTLEADGYNKTFYAFDDTGYPSIVAYTINASIENVECKPYKTTFAHWNNLASTIFDYEADYSMTFTNPYNKSYQTADSAYALYFDMGQVVKNGSSVIGTNYGIFSNETVDNEATVAVNMVAPDVMEYATDGSGNEDQSKYKNDGIFTVKTYIENFGGRGYSNVKVLVYTTGGIDPLNQSGEPTNSTYDNPYSILISEFDANETIEYDWSFKVEPKANGQYAKILYKVYDVSDSATQSTGAIMQENLLGEAESYILCPGSVEKIPAIKFTGTTPDTIYYSGIRNLYLTGDNFSMLANKSEYKLMLSRVDGFKINGNDSVEIPADQFEIDSTANKISVMLTDNTPGDLLPGMYQLTVDYTDASKEDITAPALRFQVSESTKYRNDAYGYLAVIKTSDNKYCIKNYMSEEAYLDEIDDISGSLNRDDVLLEFKGSFLKEKQQEGQAAIVYKGVSTSTSDNVMTLNDCLDIKDGTITITEENGSVKVDFDAKLTTTGAGTHVWDGVCALTELEAGTEYALIEYDENGGRSAASAETIALLWPSVGQGFQDIMGLLFEFKYGEFGTIKNEDSNLDDQRVIAFGAALDLSFIIPTSLNRTTTVPETDNTWSMVMQQSIDCGPDTIRSVNRQFKYNANTVNTDAKSHTEISMGSDFTETGTAMGDDATAGDGDTRSASIQIDDILFGGEYIGINMAVALGIPGYIEGMPGMQAILSVNTIGDWSFGASGVCEFSTFYMEGSIQIMSHDGIPIPDELTFVIGGFVPGINVDGWGILWIQGGGGGISNLYDTIFLESGIPPLKLLLEVQVSLLQVISARASLGLSLWGIDASISNGTLVNFLPVLNNASVSLQWYPEFYLSSSLNVSILDAIIGGGYIVVEHDGFFEFFLRAALQIPGSVPIIGGINIADANLGANEDKIWGQIVALGSTIGVTYFWGEEIDWFSGSPVYPTYPELVGMEGGFALAAYPVGVNTQTGETLYVGVGTNLIPTASTMSAVVEGESLTLLANGAAADNAQSDELYTDVSATKHSVIMYENGCGKFLVIEWEAESEEEARRQADLIKIKDNNNSDYVLVKMDAAKTAEEQPNANANLTYDAEAKKASLAVSFTNVSAFDKTWNITTPTVAELVLYDVAPLPALSEEATTVAVNGTTTSVTLKGEGLSEFTKLSFIAKNNTTGEDTLIYYKESETGFADGETVTFEMPASLGSGAYTLSIVARDDAATYYSEATKEFSFTNPNQPAAPVIADVKGAGDYKLDVVMDDSVAGAFDGYAFSAYALNTETGKYEVVTGVENVLYYKDGGKLTYKEDGSIAAPTGNSTSDPFVIGGHYEYPYENEETGLEETLVAGFSEGAYRLEVRRFKLVDDGKALLYSDAATKDVEVTKPVKTEVAVSAVLPDGTVRKNLTLTLGDGSTYEQDFYNSSEVVLVLSSNTEQFSGRYELDGGTRLGTSGTISELTKETSLYFANLEEGTHTLEFSGKNEFGDSIAARYRFTVDTQGPRLLLSEPLNGSLFDYQTGKVTISGITDKDALLTVIDKDTEEVVLNNVPMSTSAAVSEDAVAIDADGGFSTEITLDTTVMNHNLTIRVADVLGNVTEKDVLVVNDGLGSIEKLLIYAGNEDVTNTKLPSGAQYSLKLFAKLKNQEVPVEINNEMLVEWSVVSVAGESSVEQNGAAAVLNTSDDSEGMITASFLINDAGAYSVSAAFGETDELVKELVEDETLVRLEKETYFFTGTAIEPEVVVVHDGIVLEKGTDYEVSYENNVDVSAEKPTVKITGINNYKGTLTKTFEIQYLEMNKTAPYYEISGMEGNSGYYTSDVTIMPLNGYEIVTDLTAESAGGITVTTEGKNEVSFWMRRLSDGAVTDKVSLEVQVDKSVPTGTIELDAKLWDTFLETITFGRYKVQNYAVTVTATDTVSGVDKAEYVVSETAYASVAELEAAGLSWKIYSDILKPSINENKNQVIYVRMIDNAGNISYIGSEGIYVDTVAPEVSNVEIKTDSSLTGNALTFGFVSNEPGTYYYAVLPASAQAPDAAAIKAGTVANAVAGSGSLNADKVGQEVTVGVTGLQPNTMYVAYVVTEDIVVNLSDGAAAPNISEVKASTPVSTTKEGLVLDLCDGNAQVTLSAESYYYTGEAACPTVTVTYEGELLVEGTDYKVTYSNNKDVPSGSEGQPTVTITGINNYKGTIEKTFEIKYLEMDTQTPLYKVNGTEGTNGYYISDVKVTPENGYEIVTSLTLGSAGDIITTAEGKTAVSFQMRRTSDGALTDKINVEINIDKNAPIGTITLDESAWDTFLETITFGRYKVSNYTATVTATDTVSGVEKTEYIVSETAYASVAELEAAGLSWKTYSDTFKPSINENKNQIIYVRMTDNAGHVSYISSEGIYVDTLAPEVSGVEIKNDSSLTGNALTFGFVSNEPGTYYYAVMPASAQAPDVAALKAGTVANAVTGSGSLNADKVGQEVTISVTGLEPNNMYVVYVVAEDIVMNLSDGSAAPNTSEVKVSAPVATKQFDLEDGITQLSLETEIYYYTGMEICPSVTVSHENVTLVEGIDYVVTYSNNIEVSADSAEKPTVTITGINHYKGTVSKTFAIKYLEVDETETALYYAVDGMEGTNDYYNSDVTITPGEGYEIVTRQRARSTGGITISQEGNHTVSFAIRRLVDGAMSNMITLEISIDKSAPTGTITLDERGFDTFLQTITFGRYKVQNYAATISATDNISGVEKAEYVVSEVAYASVAELEAAGLSWKTYSDTFKPSINENKNQIIYVRITDKAGNASYISSEGIYVDTVAPIVSGVAIKTDRGLTASTLEFGFVSNEPGTYYYAVMRANEQAPDAASLKSGTVANAVTGSGNLNADKVGQEVSVSVAGLQASTRYVVYVVAEDTVINLSDGSAASNISDVKVSAPVSTKQITPPVEIPRDEVSEDEVVTSPKTWDDLSGVWFTVLLCLVCAAYVGRKYYFKRQGRIK